jgi:hypothetical protein
MVNKYFYWCYYIIYHDEFILCTSPTAVLMFCCCRPNLSVESVAFLHRIWEIDLNLSETDYPNEGEGLVCEAIGTAATPGLLCQPRLILKMTVEKQMEC